MMANFYHSKLCISLMVVNLYQRILHIYFKIFATLCKLILHFFAGLWPTWKVLASSKESAKGVAASSAGKIDPPARLVLLKSRLFRAVCRRVCKGLLNKDRLLFALRLAQVDHYSSITINCVVTYSHPVQHPLNLTISI